MESQDYSIFPERPTNYAGFWERFAAAFIDSILVGIVAALLNLFVFKDSIVGALVNLSWQWLYYALQESGVHQATLGKRALNLKVTNLAGNRISFGQATGRYFGKIISAVILLIGYFMMLWDDKKQTLHDKMAGTLVLKA
jgi:uncharacterized RDD family membrane protein YckC